MAEHVAVRVVFKFVSKCAGDIFFLTWFHRRDTKTGICQNQIRCITSTWNKSKTFEPNYRGMEWAFLSVRIYNDMYISSVTLFDLLIFLLSYIIKKFHHIYRKTLTRFFETARFEMTIHVNCITIIIHEVETLAGTTIRSFASYFLRNDGTLAKKVV